MKQRYSVFLLGLFAAVSAAARGSYRAQQQVEVPWQGQRHHAPSLAVTARASQIADDDYAASAAATGPASRGRGGPGTAGTPAVKYGRYGCTASKYVNGAYEYAPKGSFVLAPNGAYTYYGFGKPSTGKFSVNAAGVVSFSGGYFAGGQATPMEGRENRYYLVFPTNPDNRWTCSWSAAK